jgi:hypothetical protein
MLYDLSRLAGMEMDRQKENGVIAQPEKMRKLLIRCEVVMAVSMILAIIIINNNMDTSVS